MRRLLFLVPALACLALSPPLAAQDAAWLRGVHSYWDAMDAKFRDPARTPLLPEDRSSFTRLDRYPPDERYRVSARFTPEEGEAFNMPTSGTRRPLYRSVGKLAFTLHGKSLELTVYQNIEASAKPGYAGHLFIPFTDLTNAVTTYGGGRYMDLTGPLGGTVTLDLNLAYNPLCAYGGSYNCPIPPRENHLEVEVKAGVKAFDH